MPRQKGKKLNAELRRQKALSMTIEGHSERAIATALGISKTQAHNDIGKALQERSKEWSEDINLLREVQNQRYNAMLSAFWDKVLDCDPEATRLALAILTRIDLINGTIPDKPLVNVSALQVSQNPNHVPLLELAKMASKYDGIDSLDGQNN